MTKETIWSLLLIQVLSFPNQTVELAGSVYPIPFTDTTLLINFGRTLRPEFLSHFFDEVEMQVIKDVERYGGKSRIPSGGFDQDRDGFIFSVYSPQELPSRRHITREILKDVVDGVGGIVIGDRRFREVYFAIQTGSEHIFRGYGHFVAQRKGASS